jgi:hypothetical protein
MTVTVGLTLLAAAVLAYLFAEGPFAWATLLIVAALFALFLFVRRGMR